VERIEAREFFEFIFGDLTGYLCIAALDRARDKDDPRRFNQKYYEYPNELDDALRYCHNNKSRLDMYFAPFLLNDKQRKKVNIDETPVAWADGDDCPLESLEVHPTLIVRTSMSGDYGERFHFYWKFKEPTTPDVGESISKRIAYTHSAEGMDKSGWDLTQLLRVPGTYNHKGKEKFKVSDAVLFRNHSYEPKDFDKYPTLEQMETFTDIHEVELPDMSGQQLLLEYKHEINPKALQLFKDEPHNEKDWSKALFELECILLEGGVTKEETYVICNDAACNKYKRDNRNPFDLWKEVQKVSAYVESRDQAPPELDNDEVIKNKKIELLTEKEKEEVKRDVTFIEEYTEWAKDLGDAAPQYHPAGAFVILSSLLCGDVKLPTRFGTIVPNLWFMILADTTLTRKTTAMDNAVDLLLEVDPDILLATDGSIEGLLTALGDRSNMPSLFLRDEITGLIEAMTKKEYLAGMMEMLTKMYDGKHMKRILRKEVIDVKNPRLVLFAGGIRNKMVDLLKSEHVSSGFLPRFIFITAESDTTRLRPIGPPTEENLEGREHLLNRMIELYEHYKVVQTPSRGKKAHVPHTWDAKLTPDAWLKYNEYEVQLLEYAMSSYNPGLMTPMLDRLAKSGLKAAVLIGASRKLAEEIIVTEEDLRHAFYYVEQWLDHTLYMMQHMGESQDEKRLNRVLFTIETEPGLLRSHLMRKLYMNSKEAEGIFVTLEQRNQIYRKKRGSRGERLYPT